jgi:hypothetical protein
MISILNRSLQTTVLRRSVLNSYAVTRGFCEKIEKPIAEENLSEEKKIGGFAKAYEKFSKPPQEEIKEKEPDLPFATLFKNSKFVEVGRIKV